VALLDVRDVSKSFGAIRAVSGISFAVEAGEVVGLMGDNGAGKSTMVKFIAGNFVPNECEIAVSGEVCHFHKPIEARAKGIEVVYQDLAIADNLTAAENVFLGREIKKGPWPFRVLDKQAMIEHSAELFGELKSETRPRDLVKKMSGGQRQAVAIARTRLSYAKQVLMDEPTAAISDVVQIREQTLFQKVISGQPFWVTVALVLLVAVMTVLQPSFGTVENAANVTRNFAPLGIMALGMTVVIITGGIDLSIARSLAVVFSGNQMLYKFGPDAPIVKAIGQAKWPVQTPGDAVPDWIPQVSSHFWVMVLLSLVVGYVFNFKAWSRHLPAIGGNENAARLTGVPVDWIKFQASVFSAFTAFGAFIILAAPLGMRAPAGKSLIAEGWERYFPKKHR
jgi:simple sugar transport system ATP-binding protein